MYIFCTIFTIFLPVFMLFYDFQQFSLMCFTRSPTEKGVKRHDSIFTIMYFLLLSPVVFYCVLLVFSSAQLNRSVHGNFVTWVVPKDRRQHKMDCSSNGLKTIKLKIINHFISKDLCSNFLSRVETGKM